MTVKIQFILGIDENVIPEIRLTKSNNASTGTAIFQFKNPNATRTCGCGESFSV